ncbi:DNA-directed primase / polymerase protein [Anaeramoeba flamelloides]|uniref:DNA-directed primase/polymerase protein n=1 Tax=Anaeramoeba flamelloides TaxID=1746091 RepID=A0ABQ8X761_9EUKA|nr:DNA-directed primase / polymerase protein [Anaeramoeba flamelloides]
MYNSLLPDKSVPGNKENLNKTSFHVLKKRRICVQRRTKQEIKVNHDCDHIHKQQKVNTLVNRSKEKQTVSKIQPQRFKIYRKQQEAFEVQKQLSAKGNEHTFLFTCEKSSSGKRIFYTLSYDQFWELYKFTKPKQRHYNEIISEGSICNLYYDLEFLKRFNPDLSGERLVEIIVNQTIHYLKTIYGINLDHSNFIILDSSTDKKYSVHMIVRMGNIYFKNSIHTGRFVYSLLNDTKHFQELIVNSDNGDQIPFIDLSVYSKNRNFRLLGNSKFGKSAFFSVSKLNKFPFKNEKELLYFSLVSNTESNSCTKILKFSKTIKIDSFTGRKQQGIYTEGGTEEEKDEHKNQPTKKKKEKEIKVENKTLNEKDQPPIQNNYHYLFFSSKNNQNFKTYYGAKSNSEVLDQFITDQLKMRGHGGVIYSTSYDSKNEIISYVIAKDRYCQIARRIHKSNHIILSVDLNKGIWYQRCFDIDCRKKKANIQTLPKRIHCVARFEINNPISIDDLIKVLENDKVLLKN